MNGDAIEELSALNGGALPTTGKKIPPKLRTVSWTEDIDNELEIPGSVRTPRTSTTPVASCDAASPSKVVHTSYLRLVTPHHSTRISSHLRLTFIWTQLSASVGLNPCP
uniref:Uncharacterized protein n=1 Tax=Timema monikensis TaxID=170555 RepID=A0A7R9EK10_9NEOP|nr:unnamed protein product [Timema monikensis]